MKLTKFEKYFIRVHKHLNEIGLEHWLIGSSLLAAHRERRIIRGDKEVNFGVMAKDLAEKKPELMAEFNMASGTEGALGVPGVYLIDKDWPKEKNMWEHPIGFSWLAPHYINEDRVIQNVTGKHIFYWKKEVVLPLKQREFLGELFDVPANSQEFLREYYGPEWGTPDRKWHWNGGSYNHINLEGLC